MEISVRNSYQSILYFDGNLVKAIGPLSLLNRLQQIKESQGHDPRKWIIEAPISTNDDLLIQEFILKLKGENVMPYLHEELCHCRMVPTNQVHQAIKQGCLSVSEISRTTLAGTGCGSCKIETQQILDFFKAKN